MSSGSGHWVSLGVTLRSRMKRGSWAEQQYGFTLRAPQAATNWLTPVQTSLKKQISVSVLLPLRGFPKLTFSKLS